ncbi:serine/threonine-protein kinase, partial [Streptomyces sp. NPDC053750]|uniref:serine/threonine-protein kinase n=1 Tax=Streptomyces sp. NPDC053750 TaxID=3365714 RepID=UPI0037CFC944
MSEEYEAAGRVIAGRYRLMRRLGTGGRGRVWQAYDPNLRCEVALKEIVLPPGVPEEEVGARITRAQGEAQHTARLRNHPHVVTVYDVVESGGLPWIVMEFVPGAMDLDAVVREWGPLPPAEVARIGLAVLDALREGHRLGILHRDVKPANILVTRPGPQLSHPAEGCQVLLIDYGIALEPSSGATRLTAPADFLGTPGYMAPERAHGEPTPACDLFSLGATLYFALEGTGPFDRDSPVTTLSAVLSEFPAPPQRGGELTPVLFGLLAKDPARRMDAAEASRRLAAVAAAQPSAVPAGAPPAGPEEGCGPRPPRPRAPQASPPTEHLPPAEAAQAAQAAQAAEPAESEEAEEAEEAGEPKKAAEEARRGRRVRVPRGRRGGLLAGVVAVVLAAGGAGVYLAQSGSPSPDRVSSIRVGDSPQGMAMSQDGRRSYVTNYGSGSVSVIDTLTNRAEDQSIRVGKNPRDVAVSPDRRRVYVTNYGSD